MFQLNRTGMRDLQLLPAFLRGDHRCISVTVGSTRYFLISLALLAGSITAQESTKKPVDATGRENSPFSRNEADLPKGPAPRLGEHTDLSGYWIPSRKDKPVGNLGKDIPGYKLVTVYGRRRSGAEIQCGTYDRPGSSLHRRWIAAA
jgi:hypothetical protein